MRLRLRLRQKLAIVLDDYRLVPAMVLLNVLAALYRTKDQDLAHRLRLLANDYDTRPRRVP